MNYVKKNIFKLCFCIYCIIMIWLLFGQRLPFLSFDGYSQRLVQNTNLVPFRTIIQYSKLINSAPNIFLVKHSIINLAGNIVMFIPLGLLLPFSFDLTRRFIKCFLISAAIIVGVEILQLITLLGSCDIDDLIFNLIGVCIGFLFYRLGIIFFRRFHTKE